MTRVLTTSAPPAHDAGRDALARAVEDRGAPLRVLHCLWDGGIGGAERAVYQLVREQMRDPLLEPAVAFARGEGLYCERTRALGCEVVDLGLPHGHAFRALPRLVRALRGRDVHHFHSAEPLVMLASIRSGPATRVYTHRGGITEYSARKRLHYGVTARLLRRSFHGLSGNTAHASRCAARLFGIDAASFHVTYNGLEFELLDRSRTGADVRAELGIAAGAFVVGTAANLREWKRIDRLVRAVAELGEGVSLLVVGDGPDRSRLEGLARELGVEGRTVFAGRRDDVADLLAAMDAFSLPSTGLESFGNAAVEAMGLGVPAIVFADGGGMVEHIEHGATGLVVHDDRELVEALRALVDDRDLAAAMGARARPAVRERYTPERAAAGYRALYADALEAAT